MYNRQTTKQGRRGQHDSPTSAICQSMYHDNAQHARGRAERRRSNRNFTKTPTRVLRLSFRFDSSQVDQRAIFTGVMRAQSRAAGCSGLLQDEAVNALCGVNFTGIGRVSVKRLNTVQLFQASNA